MEARSPAATENDILSASPESGKDEANPIFPAPAKHPLRVMSLNLQYYSSYPADEAAAEQKLKDVLRPDDPDQSPDVIAVQEGLASRDVLRAIGFEQVICAGREKVAQSVREMVYADAATLKICPEKLHDELLCNQIYVRQGSSWNIEDKGVVKVSSNSQLNGGGGRCQGPLATRSMVWAELRHRGGGRAAYVMCTHITGGRFEDQYFVQELCEERRTQPEADARAAGLNTPEEIEGLFKHYIVSPFMALRAKGWHFAYDQETVGATSAFGHLIDHVATSAPLEQERRPEVRFLTNQKFGGKPPDTDLVVTDHNAVQVAFLV